MLLQMWPLISVVGRYYKLDTLLLKEKKLPILDVTGFFFRIRTRVMAMVLCRFTTPPPPPFQRKILKSPSFFWRVNTYLFIYYLCLRFVFRVHFTISNYNYFVIMTIVHFTGIQKIKGHF